ncbi:hypothetical protein LTR85_003636 [Meristemomyces frigidus]|nr:hypothetical protein LTR85_003636 [Meristemomyces frigidus]
MSTPQQDPPIIKLLEFPPELRNAIYREMAHEEGKTLTTVVLPKPIAMNGTQVTMISGDAMALSSRQVCVEYCGVYNEDALKLEEGHEYIVSIVDLDFDNAIDAFFSKVNPDDATRCRTTAATVKFYFTGDFTGMFEAEELENSSFMRWLEHRRVARRARRDLYLDYELHVKEYGGSYDPIRRVVENVIDSGTQAADFPEWRDLHTKFVAVLRREYTESEWT